MWGRGGAGGGGRALGEGFVIRVVLGLGDGAGVYIASFVQGKLGHVVKNDIFVSKNTFFQ